MSPSGLGLVGYDSFHFVVENFSRSRDFYVNRFDFREIARSGPELTERSGQESVVVAAGDVKICISHPQRDNSKAARFLRKHPCGVMSLSFLVKDLQAAWDFLGSRGATFLSEVFTHEADGGTYRSFEIATPLGDLNYRFLERRGKTPFAPGFIEVPHETTPNEFGISVIDHITSNMRTMAPFILWLEHVLGFERYWDVAFHTDDVKKGGDHGSGLKSIVMADRASGVKFANNEPLRPFFNDSQIAKFVEDNAGPGVQHAALHVPDLITVVRKLRDRGVTFLPTPASYYEALPERLRARKVTNFKESIPELQELQILVDGANDEYLLQIFLQDAAHLYTDQKAGPFFFEVIQRVGHAGFGEGNFRALFESIEREQGR